MMLIFTGCVIITVALVWMVINVRTISSELEVLRAIVAFQANMIKDIAKHKGCLDDEELYKLVVDKRGKVKYYDRD